MLVIEDIPEFYPPASSCALSSDPSSPAGANVLLVMQGTTRPTLHRRSAKKSWGAATAAGQSPLNDPCFTLR